jgi:hypothetical protein
MAQSAEIFADFLKFGYAILPMTQNHSCAMTHSEKPKPVSWPKAQNQSCAMANSAELFAKPGIQIHLLNRFKS